MSINRDDIEHAVDRGIEESASIGIYKVDNTARDVLNWSYSQDEIEESDVEIRSEVVNKYVKWFSK